MEDHVRIVLAEMKNRQLRSWLTILGIIIGVAAIVSLISVSNGFEFAIQHQFKKMGISNIRIVPGELHGPPSGSRGFGSAIADRVSRLKSVEYVNPVVMNMEAVRHGKDENYFWVIGYDTQLSDRGFLDIDIATDKGRLLRPGEEFSAIVGANIASDGFGHAVHVKDTLLIHGAAFRVIGIFERLGSEVDDRIYIPLESARTVFGEPDIIHVLVVKIKQGIQTSEGAAEIKHELSQEIHDKALAVYTPEELLRQFTQLLEIVKFVLVGIAAISLLVGAVGIMNSMFTSVLERTRDIGVLKAIGAKNTDVLLLFLIEAGLIGVVGGTMGLIGGMGFAYSVEAVVRALGYPFLQIQVEGGLVLFALLFSFVVGAASGLLPAMRAARLDPVEALRHE